MLVEIHTITFNADIRLFELQALSIDRMLDHSGISKYRIILNDKDEVELRLAIDLFLQKNISITLRNKIEISSASDYLPKGECGWRDQQYLKLFSVASSTSDWVILLDSKNHFVKETLVSDFFVRDKAKTYFGHPPSALESWLVNANQFFSVENYDNNAMPTVTPYCMKPDLTRLMLSRIKSDARIEDKENLSSSPVLSKASEFFLYFAFLQKLGCIQDYYEAAPRLCETLYTVWPQDHSVVERMLNALRDGKYSVFGLHRNRLPQLTYGERKIISDIWKPLRLPQAVDYYLGDKKTLWLSLGENCLTDDILRRHGRKSFSTPYSPCRSNIDYALMLEQSRYNSFLDQKNLITGSAWGKPVVRSTLIASCDDLYETSHAQGFEFTHHDPLNISSDRDSFRRKIDRLIEARGRHDIVFFYHHRKNKKSNIPLLREKLNKFSEYYRDANNSVLMVLFYQTVIQTSSDRKVEKQCCDTNFIEFDFHTENMWGGTDPDVFWGKVDDDLIGQMIEHVHHALFKI